MHSLNDPFQEWRTRACNNTLCDWVRTDLCMCTEFKSDWNVGIRAVRTHFSTNLTVRLSVRMSYWPTQSDLDAPVPRVSLKLCLALCFFFGAEHCTHGITPQTHIYTFCFGVLTMLIAVRLLQINWDLKTETAIPPDLLYLNTSLTQICTYTHTHTHIPSWELILAVDTDCLTPAVPLVVIK